MDGWTDHIRERMDQRNITESDIQMALRRQTGPAEMGSRATTMVISGYASGGRILKVVVSAADESVLVTAFWKETP